jgi:hypothetical protein
MGNDNTMKETADVDTGFEAQTSTTIQNKEIDATAEFSEHGEVNTNDEIPSQEILNKIGDLVVLNQDGKAVPFRSLYSGPNVARRVLIIFIRHFFCGVRSPQISTKYVYCADYANVYGRQLVLPRVHPHAHRINHPKCSS